MIELLPLPEEFSIYKLSIDSPVPSQLLASEFCSVTKTSEEISIIASCNYASENMVVNSGWRGFKVGGILDFSMIGVIHNITKPLKDAGISVFVISTYNTDYIFVKKESFVKAIDCLKAAEEVKMKL